MFYAGNEGFLPGSPGAIFGGWLRLAWKYRQGSALCGCRGIIFFLSADLSRQKLLEWSDVQTKR